MASDPNCPTFPTGIRVDSVEEAVKLANHWQIAGRSDLFRGQSAPWGLEPTQLRIRAEEYPAAEARMQRFFRWITATVGLDEICSSMDAVLAVAQHYGLPTCLLDFTFDIDVAVFLGRIAPLRHATSTPPCRPDPLFHALEQRPTRNIRQHSGLVPERRCCHPH
jgi:FRG domain